MSDGKEKAENEDLKDGKHVEEAEQEVVTFHILSNPDDTVTLESGTLRAEITGRDWDQARRAAYKLGKLLETEEQLTASICRAEQLMFLLKNVEIRLSEAAHYAEIILQTLQGDE